MTAYRRNADVRTVRFEHWDGTPATPSDARVTLADPRGAVVIDRATPTAISPVLAGGPTHSFTWTPGQSARLGTWIETWTATIDSESVARVGTFLLSDSTRRRTVDDGPGTGNDPALSSVIGNGVAAAFLGSLASITTNVAAKADAAATTAALAGKAIALRPGIRVISLGDSITRGDTITSDPTVPGSRDPLWWAQFYSDQTVLWMRNAGIPGDSSGDVPGGNGPIPTVPSVVVGPAGLLNGTYRYAVSYVLLSGDSIQGPDALVTVVNQQVTVTGIAIGPAGTTARKLFRTIAAGTTYQKKQVVVLNDNTTTSYVDNTSDATLIAGGGINPTVYNPLTPHGMLGRVQTDVIAFGPDWCVLLCGTNDMAFNVTLPNFAANVTAIWQALRAAGIRLALGTIPPRGAGTVFDPLMDQWNGWLRNFAATNNIPLADYHAAMVDPTTAEYVPIYDSDNTHPSVAGAAVMGKVLAATMKPYVSAAPAASLAQHGVAGVGYNMVANPLFQTSAAGVGTGWALAGGTASIVADPAIKGNWQRITQPGGAGAGNVQLYQTLSGPAVGLGWAPGDVLRLSALVRFSFAGRAASGAGLVVLANYVAPPKKGYPFPDFYAMPDSSVTTAVAAIDTGTRVACSEFTVPPGCTELELYLTLGIPNLDGGWVQMAQVSVLNLTRLGIPSRMAVAA